MNDLHRRLVRLELARPRSHWDRDAMSLPEREEVQRLQARAEAFGTESLTDEGVDRAALLAER